MDIFAYQEGHNLYTDFDPHWLTLDHDVAANINAQGADTSASSAFLHVAQIEE